MIEVRSNDSHFSKTANVEKLRKRLLSHSSLILRKGPISGSIPQNLMEANDGQDNAVFVVVLKYHVAAFD